MANPAIQQIPGAFEVFGSRDRYAGGASARGTLQGWVIAYTSAGRVLYKADTDPIMLRVGDIGLIRALTPQYWRVPDRHEGGLSRWNVVWCAFTPRPHWYPWLQALAEKPTSVIRLSTKKLRRQTFRGLVKVCRRIKSGLPHRNELAMHVLEGVLLRCSIDVSLRNPPAQMDSRVREAIRILAANPTEPLRLEQLARRCHISRSHLSYLFGKQAGLSPLKFQERLKVEQAQRMLRLSIEPVRAIAHACGFEDARYFSTRFKKQTGFTPRQYRKQAIPMARDHRRT